MISLNKINIYNMINLNDTNISYILFSPESKQVSIQENAIRNSKLVNMLYSMNYTVMSVYAYDNNVLENNYIALCPEDNETLKKEAIFIMNEFNKKDIIVKYNGDDKMTKIIFGGKENYIDTNYYDNDLSKKTYVFESTSFTLTDRKKYYYPKKKEELKCGMVLEYFNNNKWCYNKINNLDTEYDKMYKLLMKYEKLRVVV